MLSNVAILVAILGLSVGCSSTSGGSVGPSKLEMGAHIEKGDESTPKTAIFVGHHKSADVLKAIKKAAHEEGWDVTEYKSEAVIVEKTLADKTISSTIIYHNQHISGDSENAPMDELLKLRHAIVEELKKEEKH
jgi:uncharacterized Ntn-hydrolase superfamily protein